MPGTRLQAMVRGLSPSYFALVMATGIVSSGLLYDDRRLLSRILLVLAVLAFVVLLVLHGWRLLAFRDALLADLTDPRTGFGFFTFVAACDVLAARLSTVSVGTSVALLVVAAVCWLVRTYAVPWTIRVEPSARPVLAKADGTWFLWPVGAQSVAVAAAAVDDVRPGTISPAVAVVAWCIGVVLYLLVGGLIAVRLTSYPVAPTDLTPPSWIAMGAGAIAVLAGAEILTLPRTPMVEASHDLVRAASLGIWVLGAFLVPALLAVGWWRHVTHRLPLVYDPSLWGIVFPLGMYADASARLGASEHLPLLSHVGRIGIWVALAAWAVTSAGLVAHLARHLADPLER